MAESLQKLPPVLLTGATGFVGSRLAQRLVDEAEAVHVIVRPDSVLDQLAPCIDRVHIHRWDGTVDSLVSIVKASGAQIMFHVASLFLASHTPADVPRLIQSNVTFGTMLMEAATAAGIARIVNTGTSWEHFENAAYRPVNLYAATKHAFEAILDYYCDAHALRTVTLKLFDTYGPGDPRPKLISTLARLSRENKSLDLSPGDQLLDLVYIDDVCDAFVLAGRRTATLVAGTHERYAVSSGKVRSLKEVVATLSKVLQMEVPVRFGAKPYRPREVMVPWNTGISLPGWSPRTPLEEGLQRTFNANPSGPK